MHFYEIFITLSLWSSLCHYFYFRLLYHCNTVSLLFLISEIIILFLGCLNLNILLIGTMKYYYQLEDQITISFYQLTDLPPILIIIPTFNEDIQLINKTLDAVFQINYPKDKLSIVIGDDGNRLELKQFIEEHYSNIYYHTRQSIYGHAKAGNINDILFYQNENGNYKYNGQFVLILDSDMIPKSNIIELLLPYFYKIDNLNNNNIMINSNCAFVQSPQCFYNIYGYDFLGQHYRFFYYVVLKAYRGFSRGVPCCGTNVMFQRIILNEIKGFQYGSITEDFNTSLLLHALEYESKYTLHQTACGMAPLSFFDFYQQRKRWTIGGLQIFFRNWKTILQLPFVYQWIYGYGSLSSLFSIFYLFLFIGPLLDFYSSHSIYCFIPTMTYFYAIFPYTFIYIIILFFLHSHLSFQVLINSIQESIFMIPFYFQFVIIYFCKMCKLSSFSFAITPKTKSNNSSYCLLILSYILLLPYLIYYIRSFMIFIYLIQNPSLFYHKMVNIFWIMVLLFQFFPPIAYNVQNFFKKIQ